MGTRTREKLAGLCQRTLQKNGNATQTESYRSDETKRYEMKRRCLLCEFGDRDFHVWRQESSIMVHESWTRNHLNIRRNAHKSAIRNTKVGLTSTSSWAI